MSSDFEQNLEKYVDIILKVGLNFQKGQRLLIRSIHGPGALPLELAPFVERIMRKAYLMGARFVDVIWDDPQMHLIRFQHAPRDSFEEFPVWQRDLTLEYFEKGDAMIGILAANPDLFIEQDPEILALTKITDLKYYKSVSDLLTKFASNWLAISAPAKGWTEKVFPDLPLEKAKDKLWDSIFEICRIKQKDPVSAWNEHIKQLHARVNYLNLKQYSTLKYKALGTDLSIGLPKKHNWLGGCIKSQNGIEFIPNLPTEEIFTLPYKYETEGVVSATKPLYYQVMIEDITFTFSKGKVVKATAKKGQEMLNKILQMDEAASYLGEVALVPHSSPISQSGLLFYNSLIDENAACHLALGRAYRECLINGGKMSDEEFMNAGGNLSMVHLDFMIGSEELDIDGITEDGKAEPIMQKGEWAFEV
jgi:aminopeptidase